MKTKRLDPLSYLVPLILVAAALLATQTRSGAQEVTWMPGNQVWKYNQSGSVPASWKNSGFDDSAWASGPAQLGFNEGDEATLLTRGQITYYFRTTITVTQSQIDNANQLSIEMIRDDGAIVYVNGSEIRRDNMPSGTVTSSTVASAGVAGADESKFFKTTHLSANVFTPGVNTIAVEVHQNSSGSSDISFEMKMQGFAVIPVLGDYTPPAFINFTEAGFGALDFDPIIEFGEKEMGWWSNANQSPSQVHFVHPDNGLPGAPSGTAGLRFTFEECMAVVRGSVTMKTDVWGTDHFSGTVPGAFRVNLSNYKDVKVQFGLRAWAETIAGMGSSEKAQFWTYTSVDGGDPTKTMLLDLGVPAGSGPATELIVAETATKRVKVPTASLGNAWHLVGFDDSTWTQGIKGTGYERSSSNTYDPYFGPGLEMEAALYNVNGSVFMRVPFTVTDDPSAYLGLLLCMRYDDGYVAYINGHEVARRNAPGSTGTAPAWNSEASGTHADGAAVVYEKVDIGEHLDKLVVGANMLAIHGLNSPRTSSDMLIEPELKKVVFDDGGGGGGGGEVVTLNDIVRGIDGPFTTFSYDIPDEMNTVYMEWKLTANSGDNAIFLDNILVTGTPLEADSFRNWIALTTPYEIDDLGAPTADPEGDTYSNVLDYAFGGSATEPDKDLGPTAEIIEIGGLSYLAMTWRQLNMTTVGTLVGGADPPFKFGSFKVQDITYIPQFSYDGTNWLDGAPGPTTAVQIGEIEGEGETVEVSAYFNQPILPGTTRLFGRIKVVLDEVFDDGF